MTLRQPVEGQYVGFRVTGGEYGLARIGEFGVYGDMEAPALLTAEPLADEAAYTQRITDKTNLLKGEAVANKKHDYLEPRDISIVSGEAAYLTDDYINWMAQQEDKISIRSKSLETGYLTVSAADSRRWSILLVGVIPAALIAVGAVVIIRRKRK